ncbi:MAG TPA: OmpA family protein [Bryobacteraceae bacterium]|nr:OmpA family protein [Bryobacteraceae bacterium]
MKKVAAIGALGLLASALFAQGLNTGGQTKDDWEEINFEFNSAILSDGYPSLLRLADLLKEHPDYRVQVTGNTDYVGSARYNDRLALQRAEAVKAFLVHYGAAASQITTSGEGKSAPEVSNSTKEGRFMNRRVVIKVTNASGQLIKEGGISDVLKSLQDFMKQQQECCAQILKRLDKLDDILAELKNLRGENDKLQSELNDLRNQHNALREQVAGLPKPLSAEQTQNIAHTEAIGAVDEAQRRNKKFSNIGIDMGPTFGEPRSGDFTLQAHGQFFSPFGGDGQRAVQAQGEFLYYPDRKEGQFDIGLVNRWKSIQAGAFGSFKFLELKQYQNGGSLAQADLLVDYIFKRGRIGAFLTRGFKNYAILNSVTLAPGAYLQTFARVVNQQGVDFLVGAWGNAYISGNAAYLQLRETRDARPGGEIKLTQPLNEHFSLTAAARYNTSLVAPAGSGEVVFGVEMGNYIHPSDYAKITTPVPMDVPRIRYEIGTRRVGASPPVADAGPNQLGISPGVVTLNGCNSYDPLNEPLTFMWQQVAGPAVTLSNPNICNPTFTAAAGQSYSFRLTVRNTDNLSSTATTTVSTVSPSQVQITSFTANPATITAGQCSTLSWQVSNATSVAIAPGIGNVDARTGSVSVCPTSTTTYTLTATNANGSTTATQVVTVGASAGPQIVRFEASPVTIQPGQSSTLSWATNGASTVTISPNVGNVPVNGSVTVTPASTTTYTLTATSSDGKSVTSPVTVIVAAGQIPQVVAFTANPAAINAGQSTKLCWQVTNATNISITPGVGSGLNANDCATVSPSATTTYTLTATNASGQIQANVTVTVGTTQILSFTADPPYSLKNGSPVTLSWTTSNATSVVIVGQGVQPQTLPANGSTVVNPEVTTAYTLTAYGPGGQTVSVTISVVVR